MLDSIRGFHIEPTNICTLKCSGCARTRFIEQWPQHWKNHSLDINQLLKFLDIDLTDKIFFLCGNYGDPIYHTSFIDFVKKIKNRNGIVTITTNGSYRNQDWWNELTSLLTPKDTIIFSIDGIPDNFTTYRVNADWNSIQQGIEICVKSSCRTKWKYIPFSYNQDNITQARLLSTNLGVDQFIVEPSDRFDEQTIHFQPTQDFLGKRSGSQKQWKEGSMLKVNPKCSNNREHYITSDGYYTPCCYLADHRFYYKTLFGKNKKMFDIQTNTLSEILRRTQVVDFYNNLEQTSGCQYNCPAG